MKSILSQFDKISGMFKRITFAVANGRGRGLRSKDEDENRYLLLSSDMLSRIWFI